jgi:hypothetical protein
MNLFSVRLIKFFVALALFVTIGACANTVTKKQSAGSLIQFSISFDAPPQFTTYSYFIVYAETSFNPNMNQNSHYFFIPGSTIDPTPINIIGGNITYFYSNFFKDWKGALQLKSNGLDITLGPFSDSSTTDDHENYQAIPQLITNYEVNGNTILFTIPKSMLKIKSNTMYFTVVTTKGNTINNIQDTIPNVQSIDIITNTLPLTGENDTSSYTPDSPAKILKWDVTVQ